MATPPSDDGLEALRGLPAAATPLSWASEDSVLVHSAINTVENCRLKDLRLSTFQRVKSAPASLHKMIKRIAEGDEDTKSVSFADAGLAAPSPSPQGLLPRAEKEMGDVNCSGPREGPWPSCLEPTCTVRGAREWLASAREQGGESDTEDGSAPYTQHVVSGCQHGPFFLTVANRDQTLGPARSADT